MIKFVRSLHGLPTLWVGPRFPYIREIPCPARAGLQGSSIRYEAACAALADRFILGKAVVGAAFKAFLNRFNLLSWSDPGPFDLISSTFCTSVPYP